MWQELLIVLRRNLQPAELPSLPETAREEQHRIETHDALRASSRLMSGRRKEMLKLLTFRSVFRKFYDNPDAQNAERIVWMMLGSLLDSPTQQQLSERWSERLHEFK